MKQLTTIFTLLAALLLATSCSRDELPGGGNADEPGPVQAYTFTVSPDLTMEGDAAARSGGTKEELPTRCFMQILGNSDVQTGVKKGDGSFTFSVEKLLSSTTYTFLFWADNGSGDTPEDLRAVQYTPGTVAFAARVDDTPEDVIEDGVSLKHVVTKLSLQTTVATSASEGETVKVTTTCATTYNVDNPLASSSSAQTAMETFGASTDFAANSNVATFYFIPQSETQNVDVEFHLLKQTIEDVPLAANSHVTLQGDLSEDNPKWGATSEYAQKQINFFFEKEDGTSEGSESVDGVYRFYLPPGNKTDLDAVLSAIFHTNVELDLTKSLIIFEEFLDNGYTFAIVNNDIQKTLDISINYSRTFTILYADWNSGDYADFSVVSNKLKNQTE